MDCLVDMQQRITYLLQQRLTQELTPAEAAELLNILRDETLNDMVTDQLQQMAELEEQGAVMDPVALEQWVQGIVSIDKNNGERTNAKPVHRVHFLRTAWFRYAAAILLLLGAGYLLYNSRQTKVAVAPLEIAMTPDIAPGGDRAVLTLADGSHIVLDSANDGLISQQGNTKVVKSGSGQLSYTAGAGATAAMTYNMINIPRGGKYQLTLPDGSQVWINAASSLRFPTAFTGRTREVEITGEAYFEIAKDVNKPFYVKVNGMSVEVLGTKFNINAYSDEPDMKTTLLDGSVRIRKDQSAVILKPGEQAVTSGNSPVKIVNDADLEEAVAWKNGLFYLTSADIATVMRQIARWYDVEIIFEKGIPSGHITGEVPRNTSLSKTLKVLETSGIRFRVEGKKIFVTP